MEESDYDRYEVAIIGGGPAGLTTALYTTRLGHDTVIFDRGGGRAAMMLETHNVIGIPESVSGVEFLQTAREQVEESGGTYRRAFVKQIERTASGTFVIESDDSCAKAERIVLATGFADRPPDPPLPRTGRGLHYCLHCDAPLFVDESVYVMGHGESAAQVAMILLNYTDDVDLLLRGTEPAWSAETDAQLRAHPVTVIDEEIVSKFPDEDDPEWLGGFEFEDGTTRTYRGGFAMYGAAYNNGLARSLGADITDDGAVRVDNHGRTSIGGLYAVGDLTPGDNQIPVAMGEGARAGIAIHKELRTYPKSLAELGLKASQSPALPGIEDE